MKRIGVVMLAGAMAFGVAALAQQQEQSGSQPPSVQPQTQPGMMGGGMMGMGMMHQMQNHHQQMMDNMNKLMQSMKAIETQKDPAALRAKLAEHRALLEQMRSQMMQQGSMMQHMMPSSSNTPATK